MDVGDRLRLATALAHCVPGVTLELACCNGDTLTVAYHRLDATLDPCQLRAAVLAPVRPGVPRMIDAVAAVRVRHGLVHLGGGLYARRAGGAEERWFVTTLPHEDVDTVLARCPVGDAHRTIEALLRVDIDLGATVVRITTSDSARTERLDEVAAWALTACVVDELIASCRDEVSR